MEGRGLDTTGDCTVKFDALQTNQSRFESMLNGQGLNSEASISPHADDDGERGILYYSVQY